MFEGTSEAPHLGQHRQREALWRPALEVARTSDAAELSGGGYLLEREFQEVAALAGLSQRGRRVLEMARAGWSEHEMAEALGLARSEVATALQAVRMKIQRARKAYPYAGLWEVYRDEVARM